MSSGNGSGAIGPSVTGPARPPTAVELLERAIGYTRASLLLVCEADLGRPTPCREWDLRKLLRHMDDSLEAMAAAAQATSLTLVPVAASEDDRALLDSICGRARALLGHWHPSLGGAVALGELSLAREVLGSVGALEITLHGWDVAEALGRPRPIPPLLAMDLWPVARDHISDADRPVRFGPLVDVPDAASPGRRLLAHAGRQ
jgi:uncharacterized protein (TIGR03086 family)